MSTIIYNNENLCLKLKKCLDTLWYLHLTYSFAITYSNVYAKHKIVYNIIPNKGNRIQICPYKSDKIDLYK